MHPLLPATLQDQYLREGHWTNQTLAAVVSAHAREFPDKSAILGDRPFTYSELDLAGRRLAANLTECVAPGDLIVAMVDTSWVCFVAAVAASRLGAQLLPLAPKVPALRAEELTKNLAAKVVLITQSALSESSPQWWTLPTVARVIRHGGDGSSSAYSALDDVLSSAGDFDEIRGDAHEPRLLSQTEGSTGQSKVVVQSENALFYASRWYAHCLELNEQSRYLGLGPNGHVLTTCFMVYPPLLTGASVLPYAGWQPNEVAQLVKQHGLTASLMSATHVFDLLRLDPTELDQLRSLNTIAAGGKPDHFFPEFEKITGATILRCYGMSECPIHTMVAAKDRASYGDTDGRTFQGSELQVVGASGPDDVGEAYVRGPGLFLGYFGRPDLTKAATTDDGFYRTGDLVRKNQQGVSLSGRTKDTIRRGSLTIFPSEVESKLKTHCAVFAAAVVGLPDERLGERPAAAVVLNPGTTLTLEELVEHLQSQGVAKYALPESLHLMTKLPISTVGKLNKRMLRDLLSQEQVQLLKPDESHTRGS
jgi:non-ribosomal peptide synthetase component E (peptide arylation enzyme)